MWQLWALSLVLLQEQKTHCVNDIAWTEQKGLCSISCFTCLYLGLDRMSTESLNQLVLGEVIEGSFCSRSLRSPLTWTGSFPALRLGGWRWMSPMEVSGWRGESSWFPVGKEVLKSFCVRGVFCLPRPGSPFPVSLSGCSSSSLSGPPDSHLHEKTS